MVKKHFRKLLTQITHTGFSREYDETKLPNTPGKYLEKLLLHTYQNVPYFREIFDKIEIIKSGKVDLAKFCEIPILNKSIIREKGSQLLSKDYKTRKWYYNSSGGSTGEPSRFVQDDIYAKWGNTASYYWYKDILGIDEPNSKKVILWGSERDLFQGSFRWKVKIFNWLNNTVFLNAFKITEQDMRRYIQTINAYKPDLIRGYAGSLYEICAYAMARKLKLYPPKVLVSSAEVLSQDMREIIEGVFGTKVYDFYGSRETNSLAGECKDGLMHILAFHNYVEVLDEFNLPVSEGEEGRVIVTNLHNYSMPFIRYEIGDTAVIGAQRCHCGNPMPTLKKITGRITDHFIKGDGTIIHGEYFTHLFFLKDWVRAFQIIQQDYHSIRIVLVLNNKVNESEKEDINEKIRLVMGRDCKVDWDFVDEIPKTPQGKHLYTKSAVRK